MKFYLNIIFLIFLSSFMISCSTMNDWDVSKIIDKTESWFFNIENDSDEKEVSIDKFNDKELTEEKVEVEEVFPDINDVPQIKPEFEEIDESFFESENKEIESNKEDDNKKDEEYQPVEYLEHVAVLLHQFRRLKRYHEARE